MNEFVVALGLVLVIEGFIYSAFPGGMRNLLKQLEEMPDQSLRMTGLFTMAAGLLLVWLIKG